MSIKRRLKKLEKLVDVDEEDRFTITMIPARGFLPEDDLTKCPLYRRQAKEREESKKMFGVIMLTYCEKCTEECEYAKK